jgi:hypothetical protein
MKREAIETILATEEELIPTSGFLGSVMERVQEEATAPPPMPFPWLRALPGMVVAAVVLGGGAFVLVQQGIPAARGISFAPPQIPAAAVQPLEQAGWVALALGISLVCSLLSRRLAGRSGLL